MWVSEFLTSCLFFLHDAKSLQAEGYENPPRSSPDEIAARPAHDADVNELIDDIAELLTKKEAAYGLPLVAIFRGMMFGQRTRNPSSGHRNRLEEVLAQMVEEGVLIATRTSRDALVYSPGQNYEAYRQGAAA